MSDFIAGFAARHDAAARALAHAFAQPSEGFAPADIRVRAGSGAAGPKHFKPADASANPTQGWDPLDPVSEPTGFLDPLAAAHSAGFAEGMAAAAAQAAQNGERDHALLAALAEALASGDRMNRDQLARQLRQTVLALVTRIVGDAGVSAEHLAGRIEAATECLADVAESALLRVHPDDVALLEGHLPKTIFAAGDAAIARGSFVLESASTVIEDGPDLWLEQLARAIDAVAVPPKC